MKNFFGKLLLLFALFANTDATAQKQNTILFGFNTSFFSDWKKVSVNIFNPQVGYSRRIHDKYALTYMLNVFYGENLSRQNMRPGAVIYRLHFSNDFRLDYSLVKNATVSIGPSLRYRNEKKIVYFYPQPNPFEFVIDRRKSHFDLGGVINTGYNFNLNKRSLVNIQVAYRFYNRGANPISIGVFYGLGWN